MADMKAVQVTRHGPPGEVLLVQTVERPEPGPGEVRVKVSAASLNFNDIDRCRGNLVSVPTPPPFTLGMDVCGVVDAAGEGAESWLGRRVVAITKNALGGIAEYAIADAISVFDAPPDFDDVEATAFLLSFQTSHLALFKRGRLQAGETLVVHSAASGLGTAGIQLGKAAGARVIAVAGGPEKGALCSSLGADLVIDHTRRGLRRGRADRHRRCRRRRGLRPDRRRLRGALVALHGAWGPVSRGGVRRRRRQRHDRPASPYGVHREHRHRGGHGGLGGLGRSRHATLRFQSIRAGRGGRDPRRSAAIGRRAAQSDPPSVGESPWRRRAGRSTSTRPAVLWAAQSWRCGDEKSMSTVEYTWRDSELRSPPLRALNWTGAQLARFGRRASLPQPIIGDRCRRQAGRVG